MKKTLKKYNEANLFCLSVRTGDIYFSREEYKQVLDRLEEETYNYLKNTFNYCVDNNIFKNEYSFDVLFNDIKEECFTKKDRFLADKLMRGLTNYKLDGCMYTIYHELSNLYYLSTLYDDYESYDKYDYELEDEVLKNNLVKVDIKFNNYATIGSLFAIYYFKLNDETREWLLKKGDVLNFNGLEDFALLKDDTLLYATCTHEGYK